MNLRRITWSGAFVASALASLLIVTPRAATQLSPTQPDPLERIRTAAASNAQVCSTEESSACAAAAPKIISSALGASPLAENLRRLTDGVGGRVTGSANITRAVAWAVAAFHDAGVEDVHTEKYTIPLTWSEGNTQLKILSAAPFAVHLVSVAWSPATPLGGLDAAVIDAGMGSANDFERIGGAARGAVALVHTDVVRTSDDATGAQIHQAEVTSRAVTAGVSAVLWMSTHERMLLDREPGTVDGSLAKIPQAVLAREDAERLARDLGAGEKVRVHLDLPNQIGGPAEQENVVAEIRGREKPEEFVVLGAHLDSWDLGTGALDDGCNAALVIEAARAIHLTGLVPRRSVRFVLFTGGEQGGLGSRAYTEAHRTELDRALAAIIFDGGSGRITGFALGGRRDLEPGVRESLEPMASWRLDRDTYNASLHTDGFDFLLEGVPTLVPNQKEANDVASDAVNERTSADTYDKVNLLNVKLNTAVAGLLAFSIAEHPAPLGHRLSRTEVDTLLSKTGLDAQMKALNLWASWEKAERGRKP